MENESHEAELKRAKTLMGAGRLKDALAVLAPVLKDEPDNTDALYLEAVCYRYLGNVKAALQTLGKLHASSPDYGRAFQEEGHCHRAVNDADAALTAYLKAVEANPALHASWDAIAELWRGRGEGQKAEAARAQAAFLKSQPPELLAVQSLVHEGKLLKAEQLCRHFLQENPHHIEAMRLLADIGSRLYVLDDAEFLLESCVVLEPNNRHARFDYVGLLSKRQKYEKALTEATKLRCSDPGNPVFETVYANQCLAVGRFDDALAVYDDVLKRTPDATGVLMARGHALKTVGRQDDAITSYRAAYGVRPDLGDAFWSLANLKTYRFTDEEMKGMEQEVAKAETALSDRIHLCFALGKGHEDRGNFERSFSYYEQGNSLKKNQIRYDAGRMDKELSLQMEQCTKDLFQRRSGSGHQAADPIFIVGLPRAGSTLLEQILASHSMVDGTLELPNILALAHRLNGRRMVSEDARYPAVLHNLGDEELAAYGAAYIEDTQIYRKGAPFFTDKMPNNFRHIGLIHMILPNAKIIDARRNPLACCFSGYKQLFAEGQEFTYGLDEIGRYYRGYVDLMDHWDRVLPGKVLRVMYEDVVHDLETEVRRILDFCGLPFEDSCINFHKTERSVRTASSEQVRQPINKSGLEQWRNFEPWLDPLKQALGPVLG